jgi:serine O-acetyltransferase
MRSNVIQSFHDLKSYIAADMTNSGQRLCLRSWIINPVLRFTILMRVLAFCQNTNKSALLRIPILIWFRRLSLKLGFSVGPNVFGPGVAIIHYGLLIINPATRIGKNCRIHMGVHIGGSAVFVNPEKTSEYSPRIGDNVYIAPGVKIYGPIRIGSNCTIGANAVVTKSFKDDGLLIAGVPARVLSGSETGERANRRTNKAEESHALHKTMNHNRATEFDQENRSAE